MKQAQVHKMRTLEFLDLAQLTGLSKKELANVRKIRDTIEEAIESWYAELATQ
jgi:hypothetical protein